MSELDYELDQFFDKLDPLEKVESTDDIKPHFRVVKCCGNCFYSWFRPRHERCGWCRRGFLLNKAIDVKTPHPSWANNHIHSATICDHHMLKDRRFVYTNASQWTGVAFDTFGNSTTLKEKEEKNGQNNNQIPELKGS